PLLLDLPRHVAVRPAGVAAGDGLGHDPSTCPGPRSDKKNPGRSGRGAPEAAGRVPVSAAPPLGLGLAEPPRTRPRGRGGRSCPWRNRRPPMDRRQPRRPPRGPQGAAGRWRRPPAGEPGPPARTEERRVSASLLLPPTEATVGRGTLSERRAPPGLRGGTAHSRLRPWTSTSSSSARAPAATTPPS